MADLEAVTPQSRTGTWLLLQGPEEGHDDGWETISLVWEAKNGVEEDSSNSGSV